MKQEYVFTINKSFYNYPCAHAQHFDETGVCASLHGYSRSFHFTITGELDKNGWLFPFGQFKEVKKFLDYYFDHTMLLSAWDSRLDSDINQENYRKGGLYYGLRVLPYGVGMEMTALFLWEQCNPYVVRASEGRARISKIEVRENDKNSGSVEMSESASFINNKSCGVPLLEYSRWEPKYFKEVLNLFKEPK